MDKKTSIAVVISVIIIFLMVGGVGLLKDFTNNNTKEMDQQNNVSNLELKDLTVGAGDVAVSGKEVTVHYTGVFADGKKFDSSRDRGVPFTFKLGAGMVIKGWDVGVEGMKVGGKRLLVIPPELAYGPNDYGPIPGNSTLIFEVELLEVKN
jgi:FKBP-type peptidyl-prolyl cis-trans isomerase